MGFTAYGGYGARICKKTPGGFLDCSKARRFWTNEMRESQAILLTQMFETEREAIFIIEELLN